MVGGDGLLEAAKEAAEDIIEHGPEELTQPLFGFCKELPQTALQVACPVHLVATHKQIEPIDLPN